LGVLTLSGTNILQYSFVSVTKFKYIVESSETTAYLHDRLEKSEVGHINGLLTQFILRSARSLQTALACYFCDNILRQNTTIFASIFLVMLKSDRSMSRSASSSIPRT